MSDVIINAVDTQYSSALFTLSEVCQRCGVHAEIIVEMVEYGVVKPADTDANKRWLFAGEALLRLNRAQRLRQDLELNLPGLALSMDLLDEIDALRQQVVSLQHQLQRTHGDGNEVSY
ncbi:MAG TPA: chaperone modulator CbpM [Spongiibacteraceae bacterium]|nr:chaperone modulator CbpM [Spongiibacteraceae bacterium]